MMQPLADGVDLVAELDLELEPEPEPDDVKFQRFLQPEPEPHPEPQPEPEPPAHDAPQVDEGAGCFELERRGIVGDTWEALHLQLDPDGLAVRHAERPQLIDRLHLPDSRVSLPLRKGRSDRSFCLEAWSSGFPGPQVDTTSPRLTSITKDDGMIYCGPDDDGWRRGLFELGIACIQLRNNKNPFGLLSHTVEFTTVRPEGKYEFTDVTGCRYTKRILSSTRPARFTIDFNSADPTICQVELKTDARQANPPKKEEWVLSSTPQGVPAGQDAAMVLTARRDAMILAIGRAGASVPSEYAEQLYIESLQVDVEQGKLVGGYISVKTAAGWSPGWFELRSSSLSYHCRPGMPAEATVLIDGFELAIGPEVEAELGRKFSWRMEQPETVEVGGNPDDEDEFVLVDEAVPLSTGKADGLLDLMWNGATVTTQDEFDRWTRALSRRRVVLTLDQLRMLSLEVDRLGGVSRLSSPQLATSLGIHHHHVIVSCAVNDIAVSLGEHFSELISAATGKTEEEEQNATVALVVEGVGVFSRCSNLWHQLGGVAFEALAIESVQVQGSKLHARLFIRPSSVLTEASVLELLVLFPNLSQLFISPVMEAEPGKPLAVPEGQPPSLLERLSSKQSLPSASGVLTPGAAGSSLSALVLRQPGIAVAHLGSAILPGTFDDLMRSYTATKRLDLSTLGVPLSQPALLELLTLCQDCVQVFFRQQAAMYQCVGRAAVYSGSKIQQSREVARVEVGEIVVVAGAISNGRLRLTPDMARAGGWVRTELFSKISGDEQQVTNAELRCASLVCPRLQLLYLGRDVDAQTFDQLCAEYAATQRLDISGDRCAGLTQEGLLELFRVCPEPVQLFCGSATVLGSAEDMHALKSSHPSLKVAHLGQEISAAVFDDLMEQYAMPSATLDMTDESCADLSMLGMRELCALCPAMRGAVFHVSHEAIMQEVSRLAVVLPDDIQAGDNFEVKVAGVAEKVILSYPDHTDAVAGATWQFHVEDKHLKQPHSDPIGEMMKNACPQLAVESGARIRVRKLRRKDAMLLEAKAAPEVGMEVVKSMAKLRDVAAELETQEALLRAPSAAAAAAREVVGERVDCFRCEGAGRVREMRTEVTRAFASEQELLSGESSGSAKWLFQDEAACWKLYDAATAELLEEAWNDLQEAAAAAPAAMLETLAEEDDEQDPTASSCTTAGAGAGAEAAPPPPSELSVLLGARGEHGRPLWQVSVGAMTQTNLLTGAVCKVQRANEAMGQAGHPCWVCRGSGQVSSELAKIDSHDAATDQPCLVCYDNSHYHLSTSCDHAYCADCIKGTLDAVVESAQFPAWCPQCRADAIDSGEELTTGRIPPEALSFLEQRGVITTEFLFRFLKHNKEADDADDVEKTFACPGGCGQYLIEKPLEWAVQEDTRDSMPKQVIRLGLCSCGTPVCPACQMETHDSALHRCAASAAAAAPDPATMALMQKLGKVCQPALPPPHHVHLTSTA